MNLLKRFSIFVSVLFLFCFSLLTTSALAQYDGSWSGTSGNYQVIDFTVSGSNVQNLNLRMCPYGDCDQGFDWYFQFDIPISGGTFSYGSGAAGTSWINGIFTSLTTCTINWEYKDAVNWFSGTYTASLDFVIVLPSSLNFGEQFPGTASNTSQFELKNISSISVTGSVYLTGTNADQFEITRGGGNFSLIPNQTKTISVRFLPTSEGTKEAELMVDGNSPCTDQNAALIGTGVLPILSVTPDYRNVFANSGTAEFTIANLSGGTMSWTVSTNSPWITNIQPSSGTDNGTITVNYDANSGDERIGSITVVADGAVNSPKIVELRQQDQGSLSKLTPGDGAASDYFGRSVSIFGDYAIVGALGDDDNGSSSGSAYIFERTGSDWIQRAKLTASDGAASDYFGRSVSIFGDYAIVGASGDDDNGSSSGSAYIFEKPVGGWTDMTESAKLTANKTSSVWFTNIRFGESVSIFGDYAIVGAPGDGGKGSAFIFKKPIGSWTNTTETAKLTASDGHGEFQDADFFGGSVSISGDYVLVGASGDNDNGSSSGSAYMFKKPIDGWINMTQTAKFTASDGAASDHFGCSVGISGGYAIVGAYQNDGDGSDSGSAYIFKKPIDGWINMVETAKLTASDGAASDYFGRSVSIFGDYAIVGAYQNDGDGSVSGSAYIFKKPIDGWINMVETAKLTTSDGAASDYFGYSVGISGGYAIVGAYDDNGTNSGSAYVFSVHNPEVFNTRSLPFLFLLLD